MRKRSYRVISSGALAGCIFFFSLIGFCDEEDQEKKDGDKVVKPQAVEESAYDDIRLFTEVLLQIRRIYVEPKTYKEIVEAALHGMLSGMDVHSDYLSPDAYKAMQDSTTSRFSGIGIHVGIRNGLLTVIAPIEDSPAFHAGLMAGDRIVEINRESTRSLTLRNAVNKLRGNKGEKVMLTLTRKGGDAPFEVEIVRDDIIMPSVKGARIIVDGVGYVRITQFSRPTTESLQAELEKLMSQGMSALVLDLRNNPGGLLVSAIEVSQKFLKRGKLIVTTKGRLGKKEIIKNTAQGRYHYLGFPMAVLVNSGSASASEIVAGALQDNKRAVLVGTTTYGKGSVQSIIPLEADKKASAIRITTARYYTPSDREIHGKGIEPDIPVSITPSEWRDVLAQRARHENPGHFKENDKHKYDHVVDRQLERAVDLVRALRIFKK
ncbi:MAG: S41 family peptidase [Kiritimatiellae bacterium]|nr:S41 family peptidase [Kiritimatiellia bacterium]